MRDDQQDTFGFAGFTLDLPRGRLYGEAGDIPLRPKSFTFLSHMVRNAGRVVSKDELLSTIWRDVIVTEDSLTQCVHEVRRALGPAGPSLLRTVSRRGYLFVAPDAGSPDEAARAVAMPNGTWGGEADSPEEGAPRLRRDGIAVLPFLIAASDDPADVILLDGLAHDVISRLALLRSFHVIARGSAFRMRELAGDPQAAGRALNVAYVVTGTAWFEGARVRLRVETIEAEGGALLWTGEFVFERAGFSDLIGDLTDRIVQSVHMQVTFAEARRALARPPETLDAWENFHAGLPDLYCPDPARIERALKRFRTATRLAPGFARAHAGQSAGHYVLAFTGATGDLPCEVMAARRSAEDALQADDSNPMSQWAFGRVRWLEGDPEGCLQHMERAVMLSPGFVLGHFEIGFVHSVTGDPDRGIAHLELGMSLSPYDPMLATIRTSCAFAHYRLGRMEEAAVCARDAARQRNTYATILAPAAMILASAGHVAEAREIAAKLRELPPNYRTDHLHRTLSRLSEDLGALYRKSAPLIGL